MARRETRCGRSLLAQQAGEIGYDEVGAVVAELGGLTDPINADHQSKAACVPSFDPSQGVFEYCSAFREHSQRLRRSEIGVRSRFPR